MERFQSVDCGFRWGIAVMSSSDLKNGVMKMGREMYHLLESGRNNAMHLGTNN